MKLAVEVIGWAAAAFILGRRLQIKAGCAS
jgi:hypothetical protein